MKADELEQRLKNALIYGTSHPEAYMTKADDLWKKYAAPEAFGNTIYEIMTEGSFLAALKEYGEHVRAEAVKVCIDKAEWNKGLGYHGHMERVANDCAAAIEKMELP